MRTPAIWGAKALIAALLLISVLAVAASADEPVCVTRVQGHATGAVSSYYSAPNALLVGTQNGLFRYDDGHILPVAGDPTGYIYSFQQAQGSLIIYAANGLYVFDGARTVGVLGESTGAVNAFHEMRRDLLVGADRGLFRYDNGRVFRVGGDLTGPVNNFHTVPNGVLVAAWNGVFWYDGQRVSRVGGDATGDALEFHVLQGALLISAANGIFRYDGKHIVRVRSEQLGRINVVRNSRAGSSLLGAEAGLYRYDGYRVVRVGDNSTGSVNDLFDTANGMLVAADRGLFIYDGRQLVKVDGSSARIDALYEYPGGMLLGSWDGLLAYNRGHVVHVDGDPTGTVTSFYNAPGGPLLGTDRGLFRYDGAKTVAIPGEAVGAIKNFHEGLHGPLVGTEAGFFRIIMQPLSSARVVLNNSRELTKAVPTRLGIPTHWTMTHPCSAFAEQYHLSVVATNATGDDVARQPALGFQFHEGDMSFEAFLPISKDGNWTFRVVSSATGRDTNVGTPSKAITFVAPGFGGWLAASWPLIVTNSAIFLAVLNLIVFAASRYSSAAWRLATDEAWGNTVLLPQKLLLRHWQGAQLWLLDLYNRQRRQEYIGKTLPFLSLPLTGSESRIVEDSNDLLTRLPSLRHVWVQGGAGMGKTAIFLHLRQLHFTGSDVTTFATFRRHGYVLVPIEARRFPEAPFEEKNASSWVFSCILSVLSQDGLIFEDRGLLRAILNKGTVCVAIDGLNEVARGRAVTAFSAEFPRTPIFVTSQDGAESPFSLWRLPNTISEHVDNLLAVYLGQERGEQLAKRLRESGLISYLRSGYDVRLVIELAGDDPECADLPHDRIELYKVTVKAAWPEGDTRLGILEAAAWKIMSERGPNEDKRRLIPDVDAPKDLLEQLEAAREQSGRSIRLIRGAPPAFEFVHDQMNAYLAASWLAERPSIGDLRSMLDETKVWGDGLEAQRMLWGFLSAMLDRARLEALWLYAGDDDRRGVLGRALAERAEHERWSLTRAPQT